jgi:hypothetical protein
MKLQYATGGNYPTPAADPRLAELTKRHPVYPDGPDCSPHCPGPSSDYHDGYADGFERASNEAIGIAAKAARTATTEALDAANERAEQWFAEAKSMRGLLADCEQRLQRAYAATTEADALAAALDGMPIDWNLYRWEHEGRRGWAIAGPSRVDDCSSDLYVEADTPLDAIAAALAATGTGVSSKP